MDESPIDLGQCLTRVRARDEDAARALVAHLQPLVERLVRAHLPRGDDERDLIQDVFLKVFTRLDQFKGSVPFEHWVSRVVISTCLDKLRSQMRRPVVRWSDLSDEQQQVLENQAPDDAKPETSDRLAWDVMKQLLESMSPKERLLITLLDLEEKSITEVCEITGWNSGVVRIRAFRARQKLKSLYRTLTQETT